MPATSDLTGAVIEIVERRPADPDTGASHDIVVPNEIRINGMKLLSPDKHPVKVHEIELKDRDAVLVTLTLFAKRILVSHEDHPRPGTLEAAQADLDNARRAQAEQARHSAEIVALAEKRLAAATEHPIVR
jgi:hypothetical protein